MNGKPDLKTVCAIVRTSRWHQLGIQLGIDEEMLQDILSDRSETQDKRTQMFRLWIASQPGASHNQLVEALRLKVMGEDRIAQEYEEKVKEEASKTTESTQIGAQVVQASTTSTTPAWSTSTVITSMHQIASEVVTVQALELEEKYRQLLQLIQKLSQKADVEIVKTQLMDILQGKCLDQSHGISSYLERIHSITSMNEVFKFLTENRFIGYLNYNLLKEFSSEVICGDGYKKAQAEVVEYEKHYRKFIEEPAFCQLIEVFDENPQLNPGTVVGLPIVIISLSKKWKTRNKKDLNNWIPFLRENKPLLQSIGYKCILITYAIFPVHLLKVMRFLSNEKHMKILKENGITIETPSYTMKIAERLREVLTEDSEGEKDTSDEMQCQHFLLLEKLERMQQEQLMDKAYYIVHIAITRATECVNLHEMKKCYEEKLEIQSKIISEISEQSKGFEDNLKQLLKDVDRLKSEVLKSDIIRKFKSRESHSNRDSGINSDFI